MKPTVPAFKVAISVDLCANVTISGHYQSCETLVKSRRSKSVAVKGVSSDSVSGAALDMNWSPGFSVNGLSIKSAPESDGIPLSRLSDHLDDLISGRHKPQADKSNLIRPALSSGDAAVSDKSTFVKADNSGGFVLENVYAQGYHNAFDLVDSPNGRGKNLILIAPGGDKVDPQIVSSFAELLKSSGNTTPEAVHAAAEGSGLKKWLVEHGVEAGSWLTELSGKISDIDLSSLGF